jgi:hypothetical protein
MKPDDGIRRSVRSAHRERAAGDAPSMGRVARMPGTGLPKGKRKKRKTNESGRRFRAKRSRKKVIATWTALVGGVALVFLGLAVWLGMKYKPSEEIAALAATPVGKTVIEAPATPKVPSLTETEALSLVRNALAVRDAAEIPTYFRQGEVAPAGQVEFLRKLELTDGRIDHFEWLGSLDANGLALDGVLVSFQSDGKPRNRLAHLVTDAQKHWRIDFDSFARTVTPAWGEIIGGRSDLAKVRVYVAKDTYYNGAFKDEEEWLCVGLASPDTDELLMGYCKTDSPQAAALKWLFSKDVSMSRALLEIRRTEATGARQVLISRVLAEDWVIGDLPFDERFQ